MRARRAAVSFPGHPVRYKSAYSRYKSATRPGGQPFRFGMYAECEIFSRFPVFFRQMMADLINKC